MIGHFNHNRILNNKVYDVMFPDEAVHKYAVNTTANNIYSQVDEDSHRYQLMDHIRNHKSDGRSLPKSEVFMVLINGNRYLKKLPKDNTWMYSGRMGQTYGFHCRI